MISEIILAIGAKLKELYPSSEVCDEYIPQGFEDGSFFIDIIDDKYKKSLGNQYNGTVFFDLSYFPINKNSLNNECHIVSQNILREFDLVGGFRIRGKSSSVTDEVLHIQFSVSYGEIKNVPEIKMNELTWDK